jgi:hypothetical protein
MNFEKRNSPRIDSHIPLTMLSRERMEQYYGYIQNISETGLGVVTFDRLFPSSILACGFQLNNNMDPINLTATVAHGRQDAGMNYYGFHFDYLNPRDLTAIQEFIARQLQQNP